MSLIQYYARKMYTLGCPVLHHGTFRIVLNFLVYYGENDLKFLGLKFGAKMFAR